MENPVPARRYPLLRNPNILILRIHLSLPDAPRRSSEVAHDGGAAPVTATPHLLKSIKEGGLGAVGVVANIICFFLFGDAQIKEGEGLMCS
ncbi:unnamed protein product [Urochloa humidicola]